MNKLSRKLLLTQILFLTLSLLLLGYILKIPSSQYGALLLAGTLMAVTLSLLLEKFFVKPLEQIQARNLGQISEELQSKVAEIKDDRSELRAILSSMIEGVLLIDKDEKIILLSDPVWRMLELRSKDTIGKPFWEIIRNEEINSLLEQSLKEKKATQKEITIFSPEESYFSVQVSPVWSEDLKNFAGVVAVFHNVSNLKKLERLRTEFVANVSHELKTPLTTIKGFAETLKDGAMHDKEKAQKFLDIIQKHAQRLEYLVDDLLTLSAIESRETKLNLERASIGSVIKSAVHFNKEQLERHRHKLVINTAPNLPLVLMDSSKIEQVILNLLDNAIKFTSPEGTITIQALNENCFIRIDVKDTGVGIPPEHLSRIFERFYRVDKSRSRDLGGAGLGLAIVKHIVQAHGGKVAVESTPGRGSTFSVFLPSSL